MDKLADNPHSLTAALDQLRVVASSTSNDPGPRTGQHQQIGQCLFPLVAANFFVDDPAGASSQWREECWCGLQLTSDRSCCKMPSVSSTVVNSVMLSAVVHNCRPLYWCCQSWTGSGLASVCLSRIVYMYISHVYFFVATILCCCCCCSAEILIRFIVALIDSEVVNVSILHEFDMFALIDWRLVLQRSCWSGVVGGILVPRWATDTVSIG